MMSFALKTPLLVLLTLVTSIPLLAQDAPKVEVSDVRFDRVADDWVLVSVQITPSRNPSPDARNEDYVDDVLMRMNICYQVENLPEGEVPLDFYESSVRMISLEHSVRYSVYFLLPGVVRDRDELDVDPYAYLIEFEVGGSKLEMAADQAGGEIKISPEGYENFLSSARSSAPKNEGIFIPFYLAPHYIQSGLRINSSEVPDFFHFEAEN